MVLLALSSRVYGYETGAEYFESKVRPLFVKHCIHCHSEKHEREGGLLLDRREGWMQGGERGPSIVPGDAQSSLLVTAIRYLDADLEMPPTRKLAAENIQTIEAWVQMGAPGPRDSLPIDVSDPSDPIAGKSHWAFRPLQSSSIPNVEQSDWPNNPLDHFVLSRLEESNLRPTADASRHDLLRRVYQQLIGLPPTREQTAAFLADERPDAYDRMVDVLLASEHFGKRWGRHWLDLSRYADSNGLDENFLFREAWRYRNWVIDATNADKPFDRFLLEQIAGDLLPFESIQQRDRQRIGAGFLVVGPKVLLGINPERQRMDIADEHIDTIGRAILGQTLGCARCHDHKFDPIPTADYYALAGIFASTEVMETRHMLGQQRLMERLVGLGTSGDTADNEYETYWRAHPKLKKRKEKAESVLATLKGKDTEAITKLNNDQSDSVANRAKDTSLALESRIKAQETLVSELKEKLTHPPSIPPRAMIPKDRDKPADESIRIAGQFDAPGDVVARGFLAVLSDDSPKALPADFSGRMELARWLTDAAQPSGQLAARVRANRIWYHLIGRGLVRTVDNFGRTGEEPSHPELLDYLARELVESSWSTKSLVRKIVLSRTFRLSSKVDDDRTLVDPENKLLWRAHRRRVDPESLRDAMLVATGELDETPVNSTVDYLGDQATAVGANKVRRRTDYNFRSVYLPVIRNDLPELFDVFDFADPHTTTGARPSTTVPSQGLYMLNAIEVMDAANKTADRILSTTATGDRVAQIHRMFELIVCGPPTEEDLDSVVSFVSDFENQFESKYGNATEKKALSLACHALFASSRFQFIE